MGRFFVLPYKMASEGAIALAEGLEGLRIRLSGSEYRYQEGDTIVNWGNGDSSTAVAGGVLLSLPEYTMLNPDVNICINKKTFFERMQGHNIVPPFAFTREEALRHLSFPIVCRTRIEGADGQGIVIANNSEQLTNARLYTQLMQATDEYRVHLGRRFDGEIVLITAQRKRWSSLRPTDTDTRIMTGNHVFLDWCTPAELPRSVFDVTKRSMELMPELHFGGFDVIHQHVMNSDPVSRVVEVNSAPLMTPDTTRKYVKFIKRYAADRDEHTAAVVNVVMAAEEDPSETPEYQAGYAAGIADARRSVWASFVNLSGEEEG